MDKGLLIPKYSCVPLHYATIILILNPEFKRKLSSTRQHTMFYKIHWVFIPEMKEHLHNLCPPQKEWYTLSPNPENTEHPWWPKDQPHEKDFTLISSDRISSQPSLSKVLQTLTSDIICLARTLYSLALIACLFNLIKTVSWEDNILKGLELCFKH